MSFFRGAPPVVPRLPGNAASLRVALAVIFALMMTCPPTAAAQSAPPAGDNALRLETYAAPESSFHVLSTLIVGPTESILFDAQYRLSHGARVAEMIEKTGTTLKAIVLSHADHDHYMGVQSVLDRFPGTPIYMTQAGLDDFAERAEHDLEVEKRRAPKSEVPESLPEPVALPSTTLTVDGTPIEIIPDLVGDVREPASLAVWIPSLKTILAGDLLFDGIHPWLGNADRASREKWRESLRRLADYSADNVVPGHRADPEAGHSPDRIAWMIDYLEHYEAAMERAETPDEVITAMHERYPDLGLPILMGYGAKTLFKQ